MSEEEQQAIYLHAFSLSQAAHELYVASLDRSRRHEVAQYADWMLTARSQIDRALTEMTRVAA